MVWMLMSLYLLSCSYLSLMACFVFWKYFKASFTYSSPVVSTWSMCSLIKSNKLFTSSAVIYKVKLNQNEYVYYEFSSDVVEVEVFIKQECEQVEVFSLTLCNISNLDGSLQAVHDFVALLFELWVVQRRGKRDGFALRRLFQKLRAVWNCVCN